MVGKVEWALLEATIVVVFGGDFVVVDIVVVVNVVAKMGYLLKKFRHFWLNIYLYLPTSGAYMVKRMKPLSLGNKLACQIYFQLFDTMELYRIYIIQVQKGTNFLFDTKWRKHIMQLLHQRE